jgi:hypothetical protein
MSDFKRTLREILLLTIVLSIFLGCDESRSIIKYEDPDVVVMTRKKGPTVIKQKLFNSPA